MVLFRNTHLRKYIRGGILTQPIRSHFIILTHINICRVFEGSTLALFMLWILTNDTDASFSLDNLALIANRFHR